MPQPAILPTDLSLSEQRYRAAIAGSFDAFFLIEPIWNSASHLQDFRYVDLNERGATLLGQPRSAILGRLVCEVIPQSRTNGAFDRYARVLATGVSVEEEFHVDIPSIEGEWFRHQIVRVGNAIAVTTRDISYERMTNAAIRNSEQQLRALIDQSPMATYVLEVKADGSGFFPVFVSAQIESMLGYTPHEWLSNASLRIDKVHPDDIARGVAEVTAGMPKGAFQTEVRMFAQDGRTVWIHHNARRLEMTSDGAERWLGIMVDVSVAKRSHAEIQFQAELLNSVPAAVVGTDLNGIVTHWNEFATVLYGWNSCEAIGESISRLVVPDEDDAFDKTRTISLSEGVQRPVDRTMRRKDGSAITVQVSVGPVKDEHGEVVGLVGISVDISERRQTEEKMYRLAYFDAITGLRNRASLVEHLEQLVNSREGGTFALFFLDLDRFKIVNDSLGHSAGDRLLRMVAERLQSSIRAGTFIARFGGDEFAVICDSVNDVSGASSIGSRLLDAFRQPFELDGREIVVAASVGIVVSTDSTNDAGELLRQADVALYDAKSAGRGQLALFDSESGQRTRNRLAEERDLRNAIECSQFELHYQPVVDLASGHLHGVEALVRWRDPDRGLIPPGSFLPLAIETGMIVPIGNWVIRSACQQAAVWRDLFPSLDLVMAVNVAPAQFYRPDFLQELWQVLSSTGLPPSALKLEVTEDALSTETSVMHDLFDKLKSMGIHLAIDDFGTGYSSLSRLHAFPLDVVKIDRSFIAKLGSDRSSSAIVQAIASLGHSLGLKVTAEGVETAEQQQLAHSLGCDRGQGYLFSRPIPAEQMTCLLAENVHWGVGKSDGYPAKVTMIN